MGCYRTYAQDGSLSDWFRTLEEAVQFVRDGHADFYRDQGKFFRLVDGVFTEFIPDRVEQYQPPSEP